MLYTPLVLGIAAAGRVPWTVLLVVAAATLVFTGRESLAAWARARRQGREPERALRVVLAQLVFAAACGAVLVWRERLLGLVPLAGVALVLFAIHFAQLRRREQRTFEAEILGIIGLTLTAPAAYYVARGSWTGTAVWLWALCVLYFASSVFYVKLRVLSLQPRKDRERRDMRAGAIAYHALLLIALVGLTVARRLPVLALVAFVPVLARTAWSLGRPVRPVNLRRVGGLEILYSVNFLVFTALAFSGRN
jgi:hypothetical protein